MCACWRISTRDNCLMIKNLPKIVALLEYILKLNNFYLRICYYHLMKALIKAFCAIIILMYSWSITYCLRVLQLSRGPTLSLLPHEFPALPLSLCWECRLIGQYLKFTTWNISAETGRIMSWRDAITSGWAPLCNLSFSLLSSPPPWPRTE